VEDIVDKSARGGSGLITGEGAGRTIVALTTYTGHSLRAEGEHVFPSQYSPDTARFALTSASSPMTAGAAALFRDWYHAEQSALVDDPGILYANMLLMTDGLIDQVVSTLSVPPQLNETFDLIGYDGLYGAGRLRLRGFDPDGLDAPGGWFTGSVCVQHGFTKVVQVHQNNPLPAGVEYLKFVTWTYDRQHDDGLPHDKFAVKASYQTSAGTWVQAVVDNSNDNRHRIFVDNNVGGKVWRMEITGVNIDSMGEGCGDVSNRVYYAGVWEENDRDDDATLSTFVRREPAVGQ